MWTMRLGSIGILVGVATSALGAAAAGRSTTRPAIAALPHAVVAALRVSPQVSELDARPALVARLRETPHNYFRFVSRPFTDAVCRLFDDVRADLPEVNLHGDAHVEQYAVTSLGRGLSDFDESARGPYVVDLVRFGVSLELAARQNGWEGGGGAIDDFLRGYDDALANPSRERPPVRTLRRARAAFAFDHGLALRRAGALMDSDPVAPSELEGDFQRYVTEMRAQNPSLSAGFFRIKKAGRLKTGIGSALDEKYLLRVEGRTSREEDDEVLEEKLVHALPDSACVHTDAGPERVSLGMALIAETPFRFSGFCPRGGRTFWVHAWTDDYVELSIESSFPQRRDLREVAYDVGTQLGRAHPKEGLGEASPARSRMLLLESARANENRIRRVIDALMEATVESWRTFRGEPGDGTRTRQAQRETAPQ